MKPIEQVQSLFPHADPLGVGQDREAKVVSVGQEGEFDAFSQGVNWDNLNGLGENL